jgi:hypothetical protein
MDKEFKDAVDRGDFGAALKRNDEINRQVDRTVLKRYIPIILIYVGVWAVVLWTVVHFVRKYW